LFLNILHVAEVLNKIGTKARTPLNITTAFKK